LSEHFKGLARDLDVLEPKHPDSIFKSHLEERKAMTQHIDSAKQNLATTYVNAFVNAGYGKDLLMTQSGDAKEHWIYKNKEGGMLAAAVSLGMVLLWDIDEGLSQIDKYMESGDDYIVAGSYIAIGLVNSGIKNPNDPVFAILLEKLETASKQVHKIGALIGLSMAYAGSARADLLEAISPIILDSSNTVELQAIAALAIGIIYTGTCDEDAAQSILQALMEKDDKDLEHSFTKIFGLGLGLLFLGKQDLADASIEATQIIQNQQFREFLALVIETCAYAGSGNVLKVQKMLHLCAEHKKEEKDALHQIAAVLGIAMVSFGEDIGQEMCLRSMNHLLQYGEPIIKRTVPLAIGLLRISNPEVQSMDLLTKLAYDTDVNVSMSSIIALGLIGAGTNNSRLAGNLRYLASYYTDKPDQLFIVRIAQGLVHMGKGLMGLNPLHSDKFLFSNVSLAGLLTVIYACTDMKTFITGNYHYFLYYLVLSMYPRMLITLNENLEPVQTSVRVGTAVDTVGAAGRPKTITGFQTHDTPVLLGHGERAELATEEYLTETPIMENFVILRKNPDYEAPEGKAAGGKK
jgi:26S proteasome regulatory subunit N1